MLIKPCMLLLVLATPLLAQENRVAIMGDRVRIIAPTTGYASLTGRVVGTNPDVITLHVDGSVGEFGVRRDQIEEIYRSTARHRRPLRGLAVGLPMGAFLGIWFGPKRETSKTSPGLELDQPSPVPRNALGGALIGSVIGVVAGTLIRSDDWTPILSQPVAGNSPFRGGLSIRF
jgi:hypothetical protein